MAGRLIALIMAGTALAACAPTIHEARFRAYPPRDMQREVAVYQTVQPECAFEEIGMISSEKATLFVSAQEMLDAMRSRARDMGGDAIIGLHEGSRISGGGDASGVVKVEGKLTYTATVIRFTDPTCMRDRP